MATPKFPPSAPRDYVTGPYVEYQKRYSENIRESDKITIGMIRKTVEESYPDKRNLSLLDIGCHNGNLLLHLKRAMPWIEYHGGDLFPELIDHCRADAALAGIAFEVMDVRDIPYRERFDLVLASAILGRFSTEEFSLAIANIARAIKPGGYLFVFDWYHEWEQEIYVREKTKEQSEGLDLFFRPFSQVSQTLEREGFARAEFNPFSIPIDLPRPDSLADMRTYTLRTAEGERLNFRGSLFQPWCHMRARKKG